MPPEMYYDVYSKSYKIKSFYQSAPSNTTLPPPWNGEFPEVPEDLELLPLIMTAIKHREYGISKPYRVREYYLTGRKTANRWAWLREQGMTNTLFYKKYDQVCRDLDEIVSYLNANRKEAHG